MVQERAQITRCTADGLTLHHAPGVLSSSHQFISDFHLLCAADNSKGQMSLKQPAQVIQCKTSSLSQAAWHICHKLPLAQAQRSLWNPLSQAQILHFLA